MRSSPRFPFEVRIWSPVRFGATLTRTRRFRSFERAERFAAAWLAKRPLPVTECGHFVRSDVYSADVTNRRTGERTGVGQPEYPVQSVGAAGVW